MRWSHVIGWKGYYEVSDTGRVRSITRVVITKKGPMVFTGKTLKQNRVEGGYYHVVLSRPGKQTAVNVHRLVARAFIGRCPPGMEVCHRDGSRTNNHWRNLRYGTPKSNSADRKLHGTDYGPPPRNGETNPRSKLTSEQVRLIRKMQGTLKEIGAKFGVSLGNAHCIKSRKTWNHLED